MDLFEKYLKKKEHSKWVKRALTDRSYNKCFKSHLVLNMRRKVGLPFEEFLIDDSYIFLSDTQMFL